MFEVDVVIVGAGVVGLAIARAMAMAGREVLILESEKQFGTGISSRNSEVIHAGLYYPQGSLKARTCVRGRELLYRYCSERNLPYARLGKLVVAVDDGQRGDLKTIARAGEANGVASLMLLERAEVGALEPAVCVAAALYSPDTGILDSHAYMTALLGDAENNGAVLARGVRVERAEQYRGRWALRIAGENEPAVLARLLVNAGGLARIGLRAASRDCGLRPVCVSQRVIILATLAARRFGGSSTHSPSRGDWGST